VKVGDLVSQLGWEADGIGIVMGLELGQWRPKYDRVRVHWTDGVVEMYRSQLRIISESR